MAAGQEVSMMNRLITLLFLFLLAPRPGPRVEFPGPSTSFVALLLYFIAVYSIMFVSNFKVRPLGRYVLTSLFVTLYHKPIGDPRVAREAKVAG